MAFSGVTKVKFTAAPEKQKKYRISIDDKIYFPITEQHCLPLKLKHNAELKTYFNKSGRENHLHLRIALKKVTQRQKRNGGGKIIQRGNYEMQSEKQDKLQGEKLLLKMFQLKKTVQDVNYNTENGLNVSDKTG